MRLPACQAPIVVSRSASSQASTSNQRPLRPPPAGRHGQADAGVRDRGADVDGCRIISGRDPQLDALLRAAMIASTVPISVTNAGEHQGLFRIRRCREGRRRRRRVRIWTKPDGMTVPIKWGCNTPFAKGRTAPVKKQDPVDERRHSRKSCAVLAPPSTSSEEIPRVASAAQQDLPGCGGIADRRPRRRRLRGRAARSAPGANADARPCSTSSLATTMHRNLPRRPRRAC